MACKPIDKGNGKWLLTICAGYNGTKKKRHYQTIQLDPKMTPRAQLREAEKQTAVLEAKHQQNALPTQRRITLREFSEIWMRDYSQRT